MKRGLGRAQIQQLMLDNRPCQLKAKLLRLACYLWLLFRTIWLQSHWALKGPPEFEECTPRPVQLALSTHTFLLRPWMIGKKAAHARQVLATASALLFPGFRSPLPTTDVSPTDAFATAGELQFAVAPKVVFLPWAGARQDCL